MKHPATRRRPFHILHAFALWRGEWKARAMERRHLRGLDDHVLCDMGLKRLAVEREARKPFWRPIDLS